MIVYSLLYLRNFHYFQYFVIAHAHCKRVCWMLLGVIWINKISIYLSVITYAPSEERRTDDVTTNTNLLCIIIKQIDSTLPCVFSAGWCTRHSLMCHWCSYHVLDVIWICYLAHAQLHGIYSQIGLCSIDEISEQMIIDCIFLLISKEFLADHYFVHFFTYFGRTFKMIALPSKTVTNAPFTPKLKHV